MEDQKVDPIFGDVRFDRVGILFLGPGYWRSRVNFKPTGHKTEVYIFGSKNGITQPQRDLFLEVEQRFNRLIKSTPKFLLDSSLKCWRDDFGNQIPELKVTDFQFERIYIPDLEGTDPRLGLGFQYMITGDYCTIYFEDWKPAYVEANEWTPVYQEK